MGYPKALLRYKEETFLDRLVGLFETRCSEVIVVLGARAEEIRARASRPATFVVNEGYLRGMTTSLQCGLRAVPAEAGRVLFTLVDHPSVSEATVDALLAGSAPVTVPRYKGRRGHPILFSRELVADFLALPETGLARDVVQRHVGETEYVDLEDPGIAADIDDLEAYRGLIGVPL
jgi:molybdenum cofactor cytidylyltransferase